jgi:Tol biopolymer transport system component
MPITSIRRISTDASGGEGNYGSYNQVFSPDGTKLAFESDASNLVGGDTNGWADIFVKDLATGAIQRISTDAAGSQANRASHNPVFSPDGAKVAFDSYASNLVPGDTNGDGDIFVKNLSTGGTTRVSTAADGTQGNGSSFGPIFSPDGTKVAFASDASNVVPGDTNNAHDIFVKDLTTGAIQRISTDALGAQGNRDSFGAIFSPDGTKVAFQSWAFNLVPGDTNNGYDIFVKDLANGAIRLVSTDAVGGQGNGGSNSPAFSLDWGKVAFYSDASNLVPGDTNSAYDIFVKALASGAISLVSTDALGAQGNDDSYDPVISAEGSKVAFWSLATNLVPGDTNNRYDVFVKDLATGAIERISTNAWGVQGNDNSSGVVFSPDGTKAAFNSRASNLVPGDNNHNSDIFVVTLGAAPPTSLFPGTAGDDSYCGVNGGDQAVGFVDDSMTGQAGNDCFSPKGGLDTVFGGAGVDTLDYSATSIVFGAPPAGAVINLASGVSTDPWGNADFTLELENAQGTEHGDWLVGTEAGNNTLTGLGGADTAVGLGGNDTIDLGEGADQGYGYAGNDTILGGPGNDTLYGMEGTDSLEGEGDNDLLVGGTENDTLTGGAGADSLFGETGDDSIDGGEGGDVADGSAGNDTIVLGDGANFAFAGGDNDTVTGGADADVLMGQGGNDVLTSLGGADNLLGGDGNDTLNAGEGADNVLGEGGNDSLDAGGGADVVNGGSGVDQVAGGAGSDVFVISVFLSGTSAATPDVITDFQGAGTSGSDDQDFLLLQTASGNFATASFTHLGAGLWQFADGAFSTFVQILAGGGVPVTALLGPGYADTSDFGIF